VPLQSRLERTAALHGTCVLCLTDKAPDAGSLGPLVSWRGEARRVSARGAVVRAEVVALKDKRSAPGWRCAGSSSSASRGPDLRPCESPVVDAPAFPLQLLRRENPDWAGQPVVVVDEDRPQGRVLWANAEAFRCRVLPGMRYAAGLSLTGELRAGVISDEARAAGVAMLVEHLRRFTPHVEAAAEQTGTFFLDAAGLVSLYGSLEIWGAQVLATLAELGFEATLAVGFSRFGSFAGARGLQAEGAASLRVFADAAEEQAVGRAVPLERLELDPALRESLHRLGVRTLGAFLALPPAGLQTRFGEAAAALHRWAMGTRFDPLRPVAPPPDLWRRLLSEHAETDATACSSWSSGCSTPCCASSRSGTRPCTRCA
jgi:hypothetical protein